MVSFHQNITRASPCQSTVTTAASGGWWRLEDSNWSCCTKGESQTAGQHPHLAAQTNVWASVGRRSVNVMGQISEVGAPLKAPTKNRIKELWEHETQQYLKQDNQIWMENMDKVNIVRIIAALSQYWRYNVYNKHLQNNWHIPLK